MKKYKQVFDELDRAALIPFFVIGDPDFDTSLEIVKTAIDSDADILELGIPFSDPIADGPTIQKADIRSAKAGMTIEKALQFVKMVKEYRDIPIGFLMYTRPEVMASNESATEQIRENSSGRRALIVLG